MNRALKRIYYKLARPAQKLYWFLVRPKTRGVKCCIECYGKLLLVRLGYAHKDWTFPGGGVDSGETFEEAGRRELLEETGVKAGELNLLFEYDEVIEYKRDHVKVFFGSVVSPEYVVDGVEIVEAKWFDLDSIPSTKSLSALRIVNEYKKVKGI